MKILSVDDAPSVFIQLEFLLNDIDNIELVGNAKNLTEAYHFLKTEKLDVIILDLMLKQENGIELLEHVVKNYPTIKTIILSNHGDNFYRNKCKEIGAAYYVEKYHEFDKLVDCLTEIQDTLP